MKLTSTMDDSGVDFAKFIVTVIKARNRYNGFRNSTNKGERQMQTTYFGASVLMKVLLAQGVMSGLTLFVNVLIAIGTIGAVIVALFGNWLRLRLVPPNLTVRLIENEEEKIEVRNVTTNAILDEARYYHLVVSNSRRSFTATNTEVRLLQVEEPATGGGWRTAWRATVPIHCRHQKQNPLKHDIGAAMDFDVCSVWKGGTLKIHPIIAPNNLQTVWTGACDLRLSFQAASTEVDSRVVRIRITWNGRWHDGAREMQDNFKIREE